MEQPDQAETAKDAHADDIAQIAACLAEFRAAVEAMEGTPQAPMLDPHEAESQREARMQELERRLEQASQRMRHAWQRY